MNLTIVLPYHSGDYNLAKQLLEWIGELSASSNLLPKTHPAILLVGDSNVPATDRMALKALASASFEFVEAIPLTVTKQGWPDGANQMWKAAAKYIESNYKTPWLWLEPDAVPLHSGWLWNLTVSYESQPKTFFGHVESSTVEGLPPKHLAGVAIYPVNAHSIMAPLIKDGQAFDITCSPAVVQKTTATPLIQHYWGLPGLAPTFAAERTPESPKNTFTLANLKPDAVIFHRCKDGTLIPLLMAKREAEAPRKWVVASAAPGFPKLGSVADNLAQLEGFQGAGPISQFGKPTPPEFQPALDETFRESLTPATPPLPGEPQADTTQVRVKRKYTRRTPTK